MRAYILRRLLISIPQLLGICFITMLAMEISPGDMLAEVRNDPLVSKETIRAFERRFHLDKAFLARYVIWVGNVARGDLGESFSQKLPVTEVLKSRLANTVLLSVTVMFFTWLLSIPLGVLAATRQNRPSDRAISFVSFVGLSMPGFFLAMLLLYLASVTGVLPTGGMRSAGYAELGPIARVLDVARHMVIPAFVLVFGSIGSLQRIMRANMVETLRAQYITTARAKGLTRGAVIWRHAFRNAINPFITIFGMSLSGIIGGAALIEIICSWPGLGSVMLAAVRAQDTYLVMGDLLISGVLVILGNLLADILLALNDPRVSYT
ncbi:MAG: ABC transporter permease [Planctomycetota bacterium]